MNATLLLFIATISLWIESVHSWRGMQFRKPSFVTCFAATTEDQTIQSTTSGSEVLILTDKAREHLKKMKTGSELFLRMGVRSGGCSGMSYVMDIVEPSTITEDDVIEAFEDIKCVIDPKSLLFLYGLKLDYSDELIGGGFKFSNPNAETSCGCGKSFGM